MNFNNNQVFTSDHETMSRDTWEREATPVGLVTRGVKSTAPMLRSPQKRYVTTWIYWLPSHWPAY